VYTWFFVIITTELQRCFYYHHLSVHPAVCWFVCIVWYSNLVLKPPMHMCKVVGLPIVPLLQDVSHCWSVLVSKGIIQFFASYYLSALTFSLCGGNVKECGELLMLQLSYDEERGRNSSQWQVHSLIKCDYVTVTEIRMFL
jgi:hypothetical protein